MIINSRAGLVIFTLILTIAFTAGIPIPTPESRPDTVATQYGTLSEIAHTRLHARDLNTLVRRRGKKAAAPTPAKAPAPAKAAAPKKAAPSKSSPPPSGAAPHKKHLSIAAKIRGAFHKVGAGIAHAAHAVGHFVKTTGAKIAKFGLKIVATAEKLAAKVVSFIPEVGAPISKLLDADSKAKNAISDKIHVKLPGKLEHGLRVMNKIEKVSDYVPRDLSDFDVRIDAFEKREEDWWLTF